MTNQYVLHAGRWWMVVWLLGTSLCMRAQSTQPPVIQWQRTIDGGNVSLTSNVQAVKAAKGGYAVLAGTTLVRLSGTGDVVWNKQLQGTYQDSLTGYVPVRQTVAVTATPDDGFAVLALDVLNLYYVTKLDAVGTVLWTRLIDQANAGPAIRITDNAITSAPNGSLLIVGTYTDSRSYVTMTKLNPEGAVASQWRVAYSTTSPVISPIIRSILNTSDGGYLLAGKATDNATSDSKGLAIKLDGKFNLTWQSTYPTVDSLAAVVSNLSAEGTYTAIGLSNDKNARLLTISPNGNGDGNQVATFSGANAPVSLVNDGNGNWVVLDGTGTTNSDFRLKSLRAQSAIGWTKTVGGSGNDVPTGLLRTDDGGYLLVGTTTSTDGDVAGKSTNALATWVVKLGNSPLLTTLSLQAPYYSCETGAIVFNTTGDDGSPITYNAPGVVRANLTDNFGIVEPGLRNDPKVITIQATQSGQTVSYAFDFGAYCRNFQSSTDSSASNALTLIAPTYHCQTGALTFHTTGGDGTFIEYEAPGITSWTTNPNQFVDSELRVDYDAKPLILMARQSGKVVMYVLDLKAACGRARLSATESVSGLSVALLGNPVNEHATVAITGALDQSLQIRLVDGHGRLVEQRTVEQAGTTEQQTFDLRQQPSGILLLHTTVNGQTQTMKVVKQ